MFSGIVQRLGSVKSVEIYGKGKRLNIFLGKKAKIGSSISVNGVCLTVTKSSRQVSSFNLMPETLKRTNLGLLKKGDAVNIEHSLRMFDTNSGHFVMGHVDDVGVITSKKDMGDFSEVWIRVRKDLMKYIVEKGSVSVDGISLTIVDAKKDSFSVSLIPHTLKITTLGIKKQGDKVNIEIDMLARYVKEIVGNMRPRVVRKVITKIVRKAKKRPRRTIKSAPIVEKKKVKKSKWFIFRS